jgi:hypothetical protein
MRASLIVVRTIRGQDLPQMLRAEDKNVTPNSRAEAFQSVVQHMHSATAIYWTITNTHCPKPTPEGLSVSTIVVAHQIGRSRVPRKCLHDCWPSHSAVGCLVTANHNSCRRPWPRTTKANSRSKVTVGTTQPPVLGWRCSAPDHVRRDRRLRNFEPELQQLAMDSRSAPQRVLFAHTPDEIT